MESLPPQNSCLSAEIITRCFCRRRSALLLGVSIPVSTVDTTFPNTEGKFVFGLSVELGNISCYGVAVNNSSCFHWDKVFSSPTLSSFLPPLLDLDARVFLEFVCARVSLSLGSKKIYNFLLKF